MGGSTGSFSRVEISIAEPLRSGGPAGLSPALGAAPGPSGTCPAALPHPLDTRNTTVTTKTAPGFASHPLGTHIFQIWEGGTVSQIIGCEFNGVCDDQHGKNEMRMDKQDNDNWSHTAGGRLLS